MKNIVSKDFLFVTSLIFYGENVLENTSNEYFFMSSNSAPTRWLNETFSECCSFSGIPAQPNSLECEIA